MLASKRVLTDLQSEGGSMELLGDGFQLVGFVVVTATVLASVVLVAIGITVFLCMGNRKIVIIKKGWGYHEFGGECENIGAEGLSWAVSAGGVVWSMLGW